MVGGTRGWAADKPFLHTHGVTCPEACTTVTVEEGGIMNWEKPTFREVKMDAEISAYQDDFEDVPDVQEPSEEALIMKQALFTNTTQ